MSKEPRNKDTRSGDRKVAEDMRALVGEVEDVAARVRSRSQRIRATSVSPDAPVIPDDDDQSRWSTPTLPSPPSAPEASATSASDRAPDKKLKSGRYSYVGPPRSKKP